MENPKQASKDKVELQDEEVKELSEGRALYEMVQSNLGWKVIQGWLEGMAYHSWVDPREADNKEAWEWRELNAFHAANASKEILENINKSISRSEYLDKIRTGEIQRKSMVIR